MVSGFENLRDEFEELSVPRGDARKLVWIVDDRLGVAKAANGSFEIFIVGSEIDANSPLVSRHLQHDNWEPESGGRSFRASRVLLGSATHFAAMSALIATELTRLDLSTDAALQDSFHQVEPIIEMAIRRGALSDEALVGLIAELHVLRAALIAVNLDERGKVLLGWQGWTRGRDFCFGRETFEIKATTGSQSRHHFSGVHQLEPQILDSGDSERLHLLSIGLSEEEQEGQSLPEIVNELLRLFVDRGEERIPTQEQLLNMIAEYGDPGTVGYHHDNCKELAAYQRRFTITFARLYDLDDESMRLLTRELLEDTFAVVDSVTFSLLLPDKISAFNPDPNWQGAIAAAAASAKA